MHRVPTKYKVDLGAIIDSPLSSEAFVNSICNSTWFNSFNFSKSQRSLSTNATKIPIQAYVLSKLYHCNSLLYDITDNLLNIIQRIQIYGLPLFLMLHNSAIPHQH